MLTVAKEKFLTVKCEKLVTVAEKNRLTVSEERVFTLPHEKVLDILTASPKMRRKSLSLMFFGTVGPCARGFSLLFFIRSPSGVFAPKDL